MPLALLPATKCCTMCIARGPGRASLRGRRLKGKGTGSFRCERNARGVSLAPKTPFPFPFKRLPRGLGEGTWVFFGWVCAARDSKLAPRSKKKNFP